MRFVFLAFVLGVLCALAPCQMLQRPSGYVLDDARLLSAQTIRQITAISDGTVRTSGVPVVVVTIPSLASVGAGGSIESYATYLFDSWALGSAPNNRAALLLVSRDDRRARIELGAAWGFTRDGDCRAIMDDTILPHFRSGDYDGGVIQGVMALDQMIRTGNTPTSRATKNFVVSVCVAALFFLVAYLINKFMPDSWRTSRYGRRWLYSNYDDYDSGSSWGGWGGGGGGGFSGGGGASGSW